MTLPTKKSRIKTALPFLILLGLLTAACSQKITGTLPDQNKNQESKPAGSGASKNETKPSPEKAEEVELTYTKPGPEINETNTPDSTKIYTVVEQMPQFPGGDQSMMAFISKNMHYPVQAKANKEEGMVVVQFVVTDKGKIINPKIVRSASPSLDQEALRLVSIMPQWTPGRQNGRPVYVQYMLPIRFRLD